MTSCHLEIGVKYDAYDGPSADGLQKSLFASICDSCRCRSTHLVNFTLIVSYPEQNLDGRTKKEKIRTRISGVRRGDSLRAPWRQYGVNTKLRGGLVSKRNIARQLEKENLQFCDICAAAGAIRGITIYLRNVLANIIATISPTIEQKSL